MGGCTLVWASARTELSAIAYLCGCFNGAVIVSKYILRDDIRSHGSGNAGLTNFYRTFGGFYIPRQNHQQEKPAPDHDRNPPVDHNGDGAAGENPFAALRRIDAVMPASAMDWLRYFAVVMRP